MIAVYVIYLDKDVLQKIIMGHLKADLCGSLDNELIFEAEMKTGYGVLVSGVFKINMLLGQWLWELQSSHLTNPQIQEYIFFFLRDEEQFYKIIWRKNIFSVKL